MRCSRATRTARSCRASPATSTRPSCRTRTRCPPCASSSCGPTVGPISLDPDVEAFVLAELPAPPARVLEIGAGSGELARALTAAGYDVVAIDPGSEDAAVEPVALH